MLVLKLKLKEIIYSGENIGDDFNFQFNVQGNATHLRSRISCGKRKSFANVFFQRFFSESSVSLPIRIDITEEDPVFNDTGSGSFYLRMELEPSTTQTCSFNVDIIESGMAGGKKAIFTFKMEATVENVIKVEITSITTAEDNEQIRRAFNFPNPFITEADPIEITGDIIPDIMATATLYGVVVPSSHGIFNPLQQQGTDEIKSVFTPASRDININANETKLGYGLTQDQASGNVPVTIVEQRLIQMIWAEARGRTQRERIGVGWVARNRIGDAAFPPTPRNLTGVLTQSGQFAASTATRDTAPAQERACYDQIVDESGQVQQGTAVDPTLGSTGFVTPRNSDIPKILNVFDSGATGDAQKLDIRNPRFTDTEYQAVLLNERTEYENASQTSTEFDNPFVFFRRKAPNDPTVKFNTGGN